MSNSVGWQNFSQEIKQQESTVDLAKASLYYAQSEYPELETEDYLQLLQTWAEEISLELTPERYPLQVIKKINQYLFDKLGFSGDRENYYNVENSYLNRVIERKKGIPITLAVIYLEVAKRLDFPMVGIGMPGHFLIRPDFADAGIFVDVFNQGEILFPQDCEAKLSELYQYPVKLEQHFLNPVSEHQILGRMLNNLKQIYLHQRNLSKVLELVEGILLLFPHNPYEIRDRGLLLYEMARWREAAPDLQKYLTSVPDAEDAAMVQMLLSKITALES